MVYLIFFSEQILDNTFFSGIFFLQGSLPREDDRSATGYVCKSCWKVICLVSICIDCCSGAICLDLSHTILAKDD